MFTNGEPDESSLVPVFDRRSFVDDICFGSETFDGCLSTLDRLLRRFTECRISVSFTKSIFVQPRVDFPSHEVVPEGLRANAKKIKRVTEFSFPTSKKGMQSFLGALNYYSRFIQDFAVYAAALYQLKEEVFEPGGDLSVARQSFAKLQQKIGDAPILRHFARQKDIHVTLSANEWALSSTLMQEHEGKMHPVRFCGRVLKEAEMNYHPAEKEVLALLLLLKTCYTQLAGHTIHVYTRFSTLEWVHTSKSLFGRTTQFAVMLSPWLPVVTRVKEKNCAFVQLLQAGLTSFVDLEDSLTTVTPPTKGSSTVCMDPQLLYARLPQSYCGLMVSFDGSAKTEKYGDYVNMADYSGMNNGVQAALDIGATDLVIVGDSRLAIQQSQGVIVCKKESLMSQLNRHRELVTRLKSKPKRVRFADETSVTGGEDVTQREEANGMPTEDSVRLETEFSRVTAPNGNTPALPDAEDVDPLTVQRERRRRIATAQDEELRWANLKIVLRGDESILTYRAARDAWEMSDHFVLSEENVLNMWERGL
ncbi:hypothetical protein PHMEG_00031143 [Phytophthora megakarya]|uniref:Reverse transcriptase RNase H-like domain-containing protein n=1 Tax=Phytophthora megakarya TaxID=4795 RepID=A0A225V141_9STRA|nr:hypothetical protein PHMEG_00031143 [Phytophthora megakarya]